MTSNTFLMQLQAWVSGPFVLMVALFLMLAPFVVSLIVNLGRRSPAGKSISTRNRAVHPFRRDISLDSQLPPHNKRIAL